MSAIGDILKISVYLSDIAIPFITQTKGLNYLYDFAKQNMNLIAFLLLIYFLLFTILFNSNWGFNITPQKWLIISRQPSAVTICAIWTSSLKKVFLYLNV